MGNRGATGEINANYKSHQLMQHCTKEKEIEGIKKDVKKIRERVLENGVLTKLNNVECKVNYINEAVTCLLEFQTKVETKEEESERFEKKIKYIEKQAKIMQRWLFGIIISLILAIISAQILI